MFLVAVEEELWLKCVQAGSKSKVTHTMVVNECEVKFQIDTGAEINLVNKKFHNGKGLHMAQL